MFVTNNSDEVAMEHSRTPTPLSLLTYISRFDPLHYLVFGDVYSAVYCQIVL